jgi:eukaryotic-like serine/threonine-protein kinase
LLHTIQEKVVKTNQTPPAVLDFGRYALHDAIASGGMATVHLGRMATAAGVARTVAIKRMHPHLLAEPEFASMFLDEARLAMRIQHPNVVATFDVVGTENELLLVMDFVLGESLDKLLRRARAARQPAPSRVLCSVIGGVLAGLHAAHEARDEGGCPLDIVHRDVSPQNVLVGLDGVARVVDFGVAKAAGRLHTTEQGQIKGKLAYMAPEQLTLAKLDRRVDVFAAAAVLWEGLAGRRLFGADNPGATVANVLDKEIEPPSAHNHGVPAAVDAVVLRGLSRHPDLRFATAREMALALEQASAPATPLEIGAWVQREAGDAVRARAALVTEVESRSSPASAVHGRATRVVEAARAAVSKAASPALRADGAGDALTESSRVEAPTPSSTRRRSRRRVATVAALVSLLITTLVLSRIPAGARDGAAHRLAPSVSAAPAVPAITTAPPSDVATPSSATSATAAVAPLVVAASRTPPSPHPPTPRPSLPRKPDCRNPFTLAAGGIRVPRPECF